MSLTTLLLRIDSRFCLDEMKRFLDDPVVYQKRIHQLIDQASPPLKELLIALGEWLGKDNEVCKAAVAISGVMVLELLLRAEENQSAHPAGN